MAWLTRVRSHSMEPTLRDGQLALTTTLRRTSRVRRGDLVVLADPAGSGRRFVKRVVGLPGERIDLVAGRVFVDGRRLHEPYAGHSAYTAGYRVPAGHYFLLGDHRDASSDSRTWPSPYVARSALVGRLVGRR